MSISSFGDMASLFRARHMMGHMKQDISRLGMELAMGQKSDVASHLGGDFSPIAGIEHSLKLLGAYDESTKTAALFFGSQQQVLGDVQARSEKLSEHLISVRSMQTPLSLNSSAVEARGAFAAVVSDLNSQIAGRTLFAGAATDGPALASADTMLTDLLGALAGETTAAGVSAAIDDWFMSPGGGFETTGYLGSDTQQGAIPLSEGEVAKPVAKADHDDFRRLLSALAKSAVLAEGVLAGDAESQKALIERSSDQLLAVNDKLIMLRSAVGSVEAQIEFASTRNAAEKTALSLSRNELTNVDPHETATRFQALHGQMETLYAVTAKISNLSFREFMR